MFSHLFQIGLFQVKKRGRGPRAPIKGGAGNGVKQNLDLAGTWLDLAVDCFVPIELPCIGDVDVTVLDQKKVEKRRCYTL